MNRKLCSVTLVVEARASSSGPGPGSWTLVLKAGTRKASGAV